MSVSNLQRHPQPACPAAIRRARIPLAPPAVLAGHEARRAGFSLLEVMLATAILAASALVLSSLLGLGAKFGSRAEERTEALAQAQSLLDEFLAMPAGAGEPLEEITGELAGPPTRNFRISLSPASVGTTANFSAAADATSSVPAEDSTGGLMLVTVDILEANRLAGEEGAPPLCRLAQLVRRHRLVPPLAADASVSSLDASP
ncbi:MAG: prepilin-type N-terminal cleavage/methylation domain-containing protein [Planctomycetales bacterium]|nr:prepilin-type N-terminal cleavage/methylation domain-containing protein [Planctomycetales bacterium]